MDRQTLRPKEENAMGISETPPAGKAPRTSQVQSSDNRALIGVTTFLLATAFTLTYVPAPAAALAFTNNHTLYAPDCRISLASSHCLMPPKRASGKGPDGYPCGSYPGINCG